MKKLAPLVFFLWILDVFEFVDFSLGREVQGGGKYQGAYDAPPTSPPLSLHEGLSMPPHVRGILRFPPIVGVLWIPPHPHLHP